MKAIILWIAICSSPAQDSCTVATFFKSSASDAMEQCKKEEELAVAKLEATGVSFRHGCKTVEEFEREGL